MDQILLTIASIFFLPAILMTTFTVFLASCGKSFGIRRFYVGCLLRIFEALKHKVHVPQPQSGDEEEDEDSDEEEEEKCPKDFENEKSTVNGNGEVRVIERDFLLTATKGLHTPQWQPFKKEFELSDVLYFSKCGMEAIIEDDVTKRFSAEELPTWNLLTRTQKNYNFSSIRLTALWCLGCFLRYTCLLPFRFVIFGIGILYMVLATAIVSNLKDGSLKRKLIYATNLSCFRIVNRAFSAVITFHNIENRAEHGIVVANHTSPVDTFILSNDNVYAMIGQAHQGVLGILQRLLSRAAHHIWFERSEVRDRSLVTRRLRSHIDDEKKLPILIFPEGTCINNTSVMMFKKGSFEVSDTIYPIAIKYDPRFGDAFWNSSKQSFTQHVMGIMSSWALVCDVWYLPPMHRQESEDAVAFANRVKSEICRQGGLVDLDWDGGLKRTAVKDYMKGLPQEQYSKILKVD